MTASSGFLSGKLRATASYMRLPNQRTLQELYSVRLDGKLADGDCGSGVVDQLAGHLYGHIVAGSVGTGFAYIVPAMQVFEDILDRLGGDVTSSLTFEQRFFALPSDLQVQIIASLSIPDILNLRIASRNWHNLISLNETPISRAFLEHNPVPHFAICLYPLPDPSEITLHYICGL